MMKMFLLCADFSLRCWAPICKEVIVKYCNYISLLCLFVFHDLTFNISRARREFIPCYYCKHSAEVSAKRLFDNILPIRCEILTINTFKKHCLLRWASLSFRRFIHIRGTVKLSSEPASLGSISSMTVNRQSAVHLPWVGKLNGVCDIIHIKMNNLLNFQL